MLTRDQSEFIEKLVKRSLDKAEEHWRNGGYQIVAKAHFKDFIALEERAESKPSNIPGHGIVTDGETVVDEYIAFVADLRNSSKHLINAISPKSARVTGLERVYYETSALLPAIAQAVKYETGNVTEYLGDGVLALFRVKDDRTEAIYSAYSAAVNVTNDVRGVVNRVLHERYKLPELEVGVGLAISQTLVTLVGLPGEKHPKAFGECVFRATKLSGGRNEIYVDDNLRVYWPSVKGGRVVFKKKELNGVSGNLIYRK